MDERFVPTSVYYAQEVDRYVARLHAELGRMRARLDEAIRVADAATARLAAQGSPDEVVGRALVSIRSAADDAVRAAKAQATALMVDAQARADELLGSASDAATTLRADAERQAETIVTLAEERVRGLIDAAEAAVAEAERQARMVTANANDEGDRVVAAARQERDEIIAGAHEERQQIVDAAHGERDQIVVAAQGERDQIVVAAADERSRLLAAAEAEGAALISAARAEAERIAADAAERAAAAPPAFTPVDAGLTPRRFEPPGSESYPVEPGGPGSERDAGPAAQLPAAFDADWPEWDDDQLRPASVGLHHDGQTAEVNGSVDHLVGAAVARFDQIEDSLEVIRSRHVPYRAVSQSGPMDASNGEEALAHASVVHPAGGPVGRFAPTVQARSDDTSSSVEQTVERAVERAVALAVSEFTARSGVPLDAPPVDGDRRIGDSPRASQPRAESESTLAEPVESTQLPDAEDLASLPAPSGKRERRRWRPFSRAAR